MRNDTVLKTTWVVNKEDINELYFDYYDKENNLVANIIVNEEGKIGWNILNALYEPNIVDMLEYIIGDKPVRMLEYKMKDADLLRWDRARTLIKERNLILNFKDSGYIEDEFSDSFIR